MQAGGVSISHGHYSENPTHLVLSCFSSLVLPQGKLASRTKGTIALWSLGCIPGRSQWELGSWSSLTGLYPWQITVAAGELVLSEAMCGMRKQKVWRKNKEVNSWGGRSKRKRVAYQSWSSGGRL